MYIRDKTMAASDARDGMDVEAAASTAVDRLEAAQGTDGGAIAADDTMMVVLMALPLLHISEPTRLRRNPYAVFCLNKKKNSPFMMFISTTHILY